MATIIESFVTLFGLDGSQFLSESKKVKGASKDLNDQEKKFAGERDKREKKAAEDQKKRQRDEAERNKRTVSGFKDVRNEVLKLAAIFTAGVGLKSFFEGTINGAASLGYLSANLSMTTEKISAWQRASERAGGSAAGMTAQFQESAATLAQLKSGMGPSESLQWFFRLGGSSSDLKDGNSYLLARSKIIAEMFKVDPGRAALMAKQMGISEDQFDFIKQGPAAVAALVAAQEKNSAVSAKDAKAALDLRNKVLDLRDSLQSTATRILLQLAPSLEQLFAKFESGALWIAQHKDDIRDWVDSGITSIEKFAKVANSAAEAVGGWKNVLLGLIGLKLVGTAAGLVSLAGGLGGVAAALGGLTAAAVSVPGLIAGLAAIAAYGGYKAADYLFGDDEPNRKRAPDQKPLTLRPKSELRAEASRQRVEVGLPALPDRPAPDKKEAAKIFNELESKYALPSGLLDTVWQTESGRGKNMLSPAGAMGHFQFMPNTAKEFNLKDPGNLRDSADAAARKLQGLLNQYNGDIAKAAAAYNWGQGNLDRNGMQNAPKETRDYVAKITQGVGMRNAAQLAQQVPSAPSAVSNRVDNSRASTVTSETKITGDINIITPATDARGIARDIGKGIEKYTSSMNANTGVK